MKKLKIALYLDDIRIPTVNPPNHVWQIVRSYKEFTEFITSYYKEKRELPDLISFDHDLANEHYEYFTLNPNRFMDDYTQFTEKTGMHCAKWLMLVCEKNNIDFKFVKFCVHSSNPVGAKNIQTYLNEQKAKKYGAEFADCFINKWPSTTLNYEEVTDEEIAKATEEIALEKKESKKTKSRGKRRTSENY